MSSIFFNKRFIFQNSPATGPRGSSEDPERRAERPLDIGEKPEVENKNPEERTKLADAFLKINKFLDEEKKKFDQEADLGIKNFQELAKKDPERVKAELATYKEILAKKLYKNISFNSEKIADYLDKDKKTLTYSLENIDKVLKATLIIFALEHQLGSAKIINEYLGTSEDLENTLCSYNDGTLTLEKNGKKISLRKFPSENLEKILREIIKYGEEALKTTPEDKEAGTPAGAVHLEHLKSIKELPKETVAKDRAKLKGSSIEDVRYNSRLLKEKAENEDEKTQALGIKEESKRRSAAYTIKIDEKWAELNYQNMGNDAKGRSHELEVGLGDVLIDPDIKNVLIDSQKDGLIVAHRGIVPKKDKKGRSNGRHAGRIGFMDKDDNYVETFTRDKYRILDNNETVLSDPAGLTTYTKAHNYETQIRISHHQRAVYEEEALRQYSSGGETGGSMELDENNSVVDQIKKETFEYMLTNGKIAKTKLNEKQIASAKIIEEVFRKGFAAKRPEVPKKAVDKIIAAAIINAFHESSLYPSADGKKRAVGVTVKGEDSVGLFALYIKGRGAGMTDEERSDPYINTQKMLDSYVFSRSRGNGTRLIEEAIRGASVAELAAIFCKDGERPAKVEQRMKERAFTAEHMFNGKRIESQTKGRLVRNFENEHGQKGRINVASNQEKWVIGSSTVYGLPSNENWGTFATIGAGPKGFLKDIQNYLLPGIEQQEVSLPKEMIFVGLGVNGLSSRKDPEKSARENIEAYHKITEIFKNKGVSVKITTLPPFQPKIAAIKAFNRILRTEYPDICLDTAKELTTEDGNSWKEDVVAKDGLHLNAKGKKIVQAIINEDRLT